MPAPVYNKQNFVDQSILYAEQLNKIEDELHAISQEPNIFIQENPPENAVEGDIWIAPTPLTPEGFLIEIPPYSELDYGKILMAGPTGLVWIALDETELPQAEEESF